MKQFFNKKLVTSIIFIFFIFIFSILNLKTSYREILSLVSTDNSNLDFNLLERIDNKINMIESSINKNVYGKYKFIEAYGYMQKVMGKYEEDNFETVKDKEGSLHYTFFAQGPNPVHELSNRSKSFKESLQNKEIRFIYLMPPDKYIKGKTEMERGIPYNFANETADNFLQSLNREKIDFIDLRQNITNSDNKIDNLFFNTDHHWTIETAFNQFGEVVDTLRKDYDIDLDSKNLYTNAENYNFINYENSYIGSMGRKTGKYYSGVDDFTLIYPKFKTSYSFYARTGETELKTEGRFEEALINTYVLNSNKDIYGLESDKYNAYLFGNQGIVHIHNNDNEEGKKILMVKDSFAVPLAAFLSTTTSDLYLIDPRYYDLDIVEFANKTDLDMIFISFSPQDLTKEFFKF